MKKQILILLLIVLAAAAFFGIEEYRRRGEKEPPSPALSAQGEEEQDGGLNEENLSEGQPAAAPYQAECEEFSLDHDGKLIYGLFYRPKDLDGKVPTVIFSHGYNGTHRRAEKYAQFLAERGFGAYCFDFCGGSEESLSDGTPLEMSIFTERADLEAVIEEIQKLDFVDSQNLFLIGASQGGVVSALTGALHSDEIRGMVLIYPAFVMVDDAKELFEKAEAIPDYYTLMGMTVGKGYFEALMDYDLFEAVAPYDKKVLIIHGDGDTIAPISYSRQALEVFASAELKELPGAQHGFTEAEAKQAMGWILEYLQNHVAP